MDGMLPGLYSSTRGPRPAHLGREAWLLMKGGNLIEETHGASVAFAVCGEAHVGPRAAKYGQYCVRVLTDVLTSPLPRCAVPTQITKHRHDAFRVKNHL